MLNDAKLKMQKAYDFLLEDLNTVRTGRANTALVENISVNYYGQEMPIKALANITTPDAKSITITPWDTGATSAIEKAIQENKDLGVNPLSDGKTIHINIPAPTAERREHLIKQVGEKAESANVSLRNARHDTLNEAKQQLKDKAISEDDYKRLEKQLDEVLNEYRGKIEQAASQKKKEVQEV